MESRQILIVLKILLHVFLTTRADSDPPLVTIDQGKLRGQTKSDYWGNPYFSFEGIPFAEPPIGELRFKAPRPPKPWSGIMDATRPGSPCTQKFFESTEPMFQNVSIGGSEDCLTLNVYTHLDDELKPVMVWIHGGAFISGSASDGIYGEQFLISEDIVLVKIQYRLDVLGFLSHPNPELKVPGNAGLKDQVMALKWVKHNIKYFGGDPERVTIFGFSAGGASTHFLYLSPMAKGLFSRVIVQSGCATDTWTTKDQSVVPLAGLLKCPVTDDKQLINCLTTQKAEDLIAASLTLKMNGKLGEDPGFSVVVENSSDEEAFLPSNVEKIIETGNFNDVPFLTGYLPDDGSVLITLLRPFLANFTNNIVLIPKDIKVDLNSKEAQKLGDEIQNFYYGSKKPSFENIDRLSQYFTDIMFLRRQIEDVKHQAKIGKAPQYFYRFLYHTEELSPNMIDFPKPLYQHTDDIHYLFVYSRTPKHLDPKSEAYQGVKRTLKLWTTFAKTGNPNPDSQDEFYLGVEWKPVSPAHFYYLNIAPNVSLEENPGKERMEFWDNIYKKYEQYVTTLI